MKRLACLPPLAALFALLILPAPRARAADVFWTNTTVGDFLNLFNWSPNTVPGAGDNTIFQRNALPLVTWGASRTNANAIFNNTNGGIQQIIGTNFWLLTNSYVVGQAAGSTALVLHASGELRVTNAAGTARLVIGENGKGSYTLAGTNASIVTDHLLVTNLTASATNSTFTFAVGSVTIKEGSIIRTGGADFRIGTATNQTATLTILGGTNVVDTGVGGETVLGSTNDLRSLVNVSGAGTLWSNSGSLIVGRLSGSNLLTIGPGARVESDDTFIGDGPNSDNNLVSVLGAGSVWTNRGFFWMGNTGSGNRLVIGSGARVQSWGGADIGVNPGGNSNEVLVTGVNSRWDVAFHLSVGNFGDANRLVVTNSGIISVGGNLYLGENTNFSSGNRLIVWGGVRVTNSAGTGTLDLRRGTNELNNGSLILDRLIATNPGLSAFEFHEGLLTINQSSSLRLTNEDFLIGRRTNDTAVMNLFGGTHRVDVGANDTVLGGATNLTSTVTVLGTNTVWTNTGGLIVGRTGDFNLLDIRQGARVYSAGAELGTTLISSNNRVVVRDAGSFWSNSAPLYVGFAGSGNQVIVSNGARVATTEGRLGNSPSSANNRVVVTGSNSVWSAGNSLFVGWLGPSNSLIVSNGGQVITGQSWVGYSSNNTVIVTDAGSRWMAGSSLTVGQDDSENRLIIANGGLVASGEGEIGGFSGANRNVVTVTGAGSVWSNDTLISVGQGNVVFQNRLEILNGGAVLNGGDGFIGFNSGGASNSVIVAGAGSLFRNQGRFVVGGNQGASLLVVSNGGRMEVLGGSLRIGSNPSSTNNRVIVDGGILIATNAGGTNQFDIRRGTNVLNAGLIEADRLLLTNAAGAFDFNGGTLITRDATVSSGAPFIIGRAGTTPAVWDVRAGTGNHLVFGDFYLGDAGQFNVLAITNGATLAVLGGNTYVGVAAASDGNRALVSGAGSLWSNAANIYLGFDGDRNELLVSNGGVVRSLAAAIGVNLGASNRATVTGADSAWLVSQDLQLGSFSPGNQLVISNGGVVRNGDASIGSVSFSSNNLAVLTGAGSLWSNHNLTVGFEGGGNQVIVNPGAALIVSNMLTVGAEPSSLGNRVVVRNELRITNAANTGTLNIVRGTNEFISGQIVVDRLLVTNGAGEFLFTGGLLRTEATTNNNGRVFTVGAGAGGILELAGGTHRFANHLLISSNATLRGNGTVIGNVTNFGNIRPGITAGGLTIQGNLLLRPSANLTFELGGLIPTNQYDQLTVTNFVEFAGTLSLALLPGFLPDNDDTFTLMRFASSSGAFANAPLGGRVSLTNNLASFAVNYSFTNLVIGDIEYVDTDGDGQGDLQEQAAGTDAANSYDVLMITSLTVDALGRYVVQFQSVPGKSYRVEYTDNLVTWNPAVGAVFTAPAPGVGQWVDDGSLTGGLATSMRSYRVGLQ